LACIAIQSNQNDQHGGQSIPNFDYAMSGGVKKTYRNRYIYNIARSLSLMLGIENDVEIAKQICAEVEDEKGISPILDNSNDYQKYEFEKLLKYTDKENAKKIQEFT
jgi:ribonucleoside-triphosphate reductase